MNLRIALACLGLAPAAALAAGSVEVRFEQPEKFSDVKYSSYPSERDREVILGQLASHLQRVATPRVADGSRLEVSVSEVDMAGEYEPGRSPQAANLRIVKDIYPPRITLSYRLVGADGQVQREARRELRDTAFLMRMGTTSRSDSLRFEKSLLEDWVEKEFPSR